jgi:hypothetical protein
MSTGSMFRCSGVTMCQCSNALRGRLSPIRALPPPPAFDHLRGCSSADNCPIASSTTAPLLQLVALSASPGTPHRLTGQWPVRSVQKVHAALRCVALSCRVHCWTEPSPNKLLRLRPRVGPYYRSLRLRCRRPSRRGRPSRVGLQKRAARRARTSSAYHLGMVLSLWAI